MNENLEIMAKDAGIEEHFTTYTISHSWATNVKFMGITTEVISDGLGHNFSKTIQINLKSFTNHILVNPKRLMLS